MLRRVIVRKSECERVLRPARYECRHDCFTKSMLALMKAAGVNSVELTLR